jgi:hypothetical protein
VTAGGGPYTTTFTIAEATLLPPISGNPVVVRFEARERNDQGSIDRVPSNLTPSVGVNEVIFN